MLIGGPQLRTRSALLGKLCAIHSVTAAASKSCHIVKRPNQRHVFWQPGKKCLQIQKVRDPVQVDYITLRNLATGIHVKWTSIIAKKRLILRSASRISAHG